MKRCGVVTVVLLAASAMAATQDRPFNQPPPGFTALFNGKDLSGWRGRKPNFDPAVERQLTKAELSALQTIWNTERDQHWKVDVAKGEIVSDGNNPHLATEQTYGDFELWVDWLMVSPNGDSGIYLRGYPQVQIWDPSNQRELKNGADKGSGALWNNNPDNPGRFPLVKTDKPVGQWNTLRIVMTGNRASIWMNGQQTVDNQVMDNYFNRSAQIVARGPIELQTHGSEMRFRNVFIKEASATTAVPAR
jgi:hypothetical protein